MLVIGIVIIAVGVLLMGIDHMGALEDSASEIVADFDEEEGRFRSFDVGDTIDIRGEITDKQDIAIGYQYTIDDVHHVSTGAGTFIVSDEIDVGTTVTVRYEVAEDNGGHFLSQSEVYKAPFLLTVIGIVLMIIGVIVTILGYFKKKTSRKDKINNKGE